MKSFIKETYFRLIDEVSLENKRYLYEDFDIRNRLTGLVGPRGVGKTTLMLQYIKEHLFEEGKTFYFSADFVYFNQVSLVEFVSDLHSQEGYQVFFIDEIHKYQNWNQELKNLYDAFPKLKFVFSGSSMIDLVEGSHDLSRRAKLYHLNGMSFREYINFVTGKDYPVIEYEKLLSRYRDYGETLSEIPRLASHFCEYLKAGYYPFFFEDPLSFYEKLFRIVEKIIYEDIANYYKLKTPNLHYFKKILSFLASIPPGEVNTNNISASIKLDHKTVFHYLTILEEVGLVRFIYPNEDGHKMLRKPQKIFVHNTSLLNALESYRGKEALSGSLREIFFMQALSDSGRDVFYSKPGDFEIEGIFFEIGGKNKKRHQIKEIEDNAFIVKDNVIIPEDKMIPLLYFGFLY